MATSVDLTKDIRRILVRNWLDMGKVRLQVAGTTVIIRGRLKKSRSEEPVNGMFIEELETQMRGVKGLKNLRWQLEEWVHDRGKWQARPK